jgi:uncharacterized protein YjbJ (UPF0337 family)
MNKDRIEGSAEQTKGAVKEAAGKADKSTSAARQVSSGFSLPD